MPRPGSNVAQQTVVESLPSIGTLYTDTYTVVTPAGGTSSTIFGTVTGTITAAIVQGRALSVISQAQVVGFSQDSGTIIGARIVGVGKGLGSLVGSVTAGTVVADTNTMLVQLYIVSVTGTVFGTVPGVNTPVLPTTVAAGTNTKGTIVIQEIGR